MEAVVIVAVVLAEPQVWMLVEPRDTVMPLGLVAVSDTVGQKPLTLATVIVEFAEEPGFMEKELGLADMEKSWTVRGRVVCAVHGGL